MVNLIYQENQSKFKINNNMKYKHLLYIALTFLAVACDNDPQIIPSDFNSEETKALQAFYMPKMQGDWCMEDSIIGKTDTLYLFAQLHLTERGEYTAFFREGYNDSIKVDSYNVDIDGPHFVESDTFRYETNDSITGTWTLVHRADNYNQFLVRSKSKNLLQVDKQNTHSIFMIWNNALQFLDCTDDKLVLLWNNRRILTFEKRQGCPSF